MVENSCFDEMGALEGGKKGADRCPYAYLVA